MTLNASDPCPWKSWTQDSTLWRPAEALSLLPWGRIHHCPSMASSACCIALREACLPLVVVLLQWMRDCALYVARAPDLVHAVREFTEDQRCCHVVSLPKLAQWQPNQTLFFGPSKTPALFWTLYTAVVCAPRLFQPMYTPNQAPAKPYVYIYRGINNKISLKKPYLSPNLSSWTLCKEVAQKFAGTGGLVLQLRLTSDIAALNLHCLPYDVSGIPGNSVSTTPCKHQAWDPIFPSLKPKERDLLLKIQQGGLLSPPSVSLGHVSHYPTEYEVLVQPLILYDLRAVTPLDPNEQCMSYEPQRVQTLTVHKGIKPGSLRWTVDTAVETTATRCKDFLGPTSDPHIRVLQQKADHDIPRIGLTQNFITIHIDCGPFGAVNGRITSIQMSFHDIHRFLSFHTRRTGILQFRSSHLDSASQTLQHLQMRWIYTGQSHTSSSADHPPYPHLELEYVAPLYDAIPTDVLLRHKNNQDPDVIAINFSLLSHTLQEMYQSPPFFGPSYRLGAGPFLGTSYTLGDPNA